MKFLEKIIKFFYPSYCCHDWEYLSSRSLIDINREFNFYPNSLSELGNLFHHRICLKCDKEEDTITSKVKEVKREATRDRKLYHLRKVMAKEKSEQNALKNKG